MSDTKRPNRNSKNNPSKPRKFGGGKAKPFGKKPFGDKKDSNKPNYGKPKRDFKKKFDNKKPYNKDSKKPYKPRDSKPREDSTSEDREFKPLKIPALFEVEITVISDDGEPFAVPTDRQLVGYYPRILVDPKANVTVGDKITVEIVDDQQGVAFANVVQAPKKKERREFTFLAVVEKSLPGYIKPFSKEIASASFAVDTKHDAPAGTVIRVKPGKRPSRGPTPCELVEVVGKTPAGLESAIAIDNHGITVDFPKEVLAECEGLESFTSKYIGEREDLRSIPIVTIDGADAKDFDDAVWAEEADNGGYHIIVAIADVAHYIKQGSVLDDEALNRGNSAYFPDRVVPMLPEKLSNDLCSLRPHEDRPVMVAHMWISAKGRLRKFEFRRAVIHSHARLTYEQAQDAFDGKPDDITKNLMQSTLLPLQAAAKVLLQARKNRHALDIDIPEAKIVANERGEITTIENRERLFTHQMIEELMVLANVAAATALETKGAPCVYRIHPEPSEEKLDTLRAVLKNHSLPFSKSRGPGQHEYAALVSKIRIHPAKETLMRTILQSQQQAKYDQENVGHYGLALQKYAHFTSPIRRYSDLIVHRLLLENLGLPEADKTNYEPSNLNRTAEHLNITERRAQKAEWEARDRLIARFYSSHVGERYDATVISVLKFGCFMRAEDVAEGLMPMRLMSDDHYIFNEKTKSLRGAKTKKMIRIGDTLKVKLAAADIVDGKLTFAPV